MRTWIMLLLIISVASAANLGDSPDYLMNSVGFNFLEMMGGQSAPVALGLVIFVLMAYLALTYKLDRGALIFVGFLVIGTMISSNALPAEAWWMLILIAGALGGYGALNALRQGAY